MLCTCASLPDSGEKHSVSEDVDRGGFDPARKLEWKRLTTHDVKGPLTLS